MFSELRLYHGGVLAGGADAVCVHVNMWANEFFVGWMISGAWVLPRGYPHPTGCAEPRSATVSGKSGTPYDVFATVISLAVNQEA